MIISSVHPWDDPRIFYREAISLSKNYTVEVHAPAPFEGGDLATCGTWSADDPGDARQMLADCPPLTKGELP